MKELKTNIGYTYLEVSLTEVAAFAQHDEVLTCDGCGKPHKNDNKAFYIPVLHYTNCESCFKSWLKTAIFYKEDMSFEKSALKRVKSLLIKTKSNNETN